ncbi:MAG TPA: UDP-N-acetylmuramoyl-tripeptide--D-alanyl-D-alanine ligase [Solirubrobacteraceae bacterium]|jgi:UDP-N-acetylmuramoyl-tripeptide--D-alanyl-D-alanine ligase|nr:UDP-N-acetylmuramoyl-tripeptide--D-alanyl-D-alanine ligase [Solirubrobacteraceae bacterium]
MRSWGAEQVAAAAAARVHAAGAAGAPGPAGASVDTRTLAPGELFVALSGEHTDGTRFAAEALARGAWGVLLPDGALAAAGEALPADATVLAHPDPLAALGALARSWRRELGARGAHVIAITGSTGKTSTKDILAALLRSHLRTAATPANLNTEIGLPLAILAAPAETEALVLEMAMRGPGQIAELTAIAEPDVGVIVNVGPAHLELLGSLEAIAAAKAELIAGLAPGATAVLPADEPLLAPHLRPDLRTVTFGAEGADVSLRSRDPDGTVRIAVESGEEELVLLPSFSQAHNLENLLAAVAAARAVGVEPGGPLHVEFSPGRGQRLSLAGGVTVLDDCYNANPMSMRAAIDELAGTPARRRVAVLGDMLELGARAPELHRELGPLASAAGVELLITVGPLAAEIAAGYTGEARSAPDAAAAAELALELVGPGDTVLVKASRGVGLERVVEALSAGVGGEGSTGARAAAPDAVGTRPGTSTPVGTAGQTRPDGRR